MELGINIDTYESFYLSANAAYGPAIYTIIKESVMRTSFLYRPNMRFVQFNSSDNKVGTVTKYLYDYIN